MEILLNPQPVDQRRGGVARLTQGHLADHQYNTGRQPIRSFRVLATLTQGVHPPGGYLH
jgi:hypothetical protein